MITPTLCRPLVTTLALALALSTASAKIIDLERAQLVLLPVLEPTKVAMTMTPEERRLRAGDLISIFVPDKAELKFVGPDGPSSAIVPLDEERYRELSTQGGGHVAEPGIPPVGGRSWKRFGAAKTGVVHLQIRQAGKFKWFRFDIAAAPEFKYGSIVRRDDKDQGAPMSLTDYDQLVLDLPGEVGDGWTIGPETGLKLVSLAEAADHRVKLTLTVVRLEGVPAEQSLVVRNAAKQFNYVWRRTGVPLSP